MWKVPFQDFGPGLKERQRVSWALYSELWGNMTSSLKLLLLWPPHQHGGTWNYEKNKPIFSGVTFIWVLYHSKRKGNKTDLVLCTKCKTEILKIAWIHLRLSPAHILIGASRSPSIWLLSGAFEDCGWYLDFLPFGVLLMLIPPF